MYHVQFRNDKDPRRAKIYIFTWKYVYNIYPAKKFLQFQLGLSTEYLSKNWTDQVSDLYSIGNSMTTFEKCFMFHAPDVREETSCWPAVSVFCCKVTYRWSFCVVPPCIYYPDINKVHPSDPIDVGTVMLARALYSTEGRHLQWHSRKS